MTNDELLQQITARFDEIVKNDKEIISLKEALVARKAGYEKANRYSELIGKALQQAIAENINPEMLPNGVMYEEMARAILEPTLKTNFELVTEYTQMMQTQLYRKDGLGLNALAPKYDPEKTEGIVKYISGLPYEERQAEFLETIVTNTMKNVDDSLKENAEFMAKSGAIIEVERVLAPDETRETSTGRTYDVPCSLCEEVAGTYSYGDEPDEFWMRHEGCRCSIIISRADGTTEER